MAARLRASWLAWVCGALTAGVLLGFLFVVAAPAFAGEAGAQWTVSSVSRPTNFAVGGSEDSYVVLVTNSGTGASEGPVDITDELPAGLEPLPGVTGEDELGAEHGLASAYFSQDCAETGSGGVSCSYSGVVQPDDTMVLRFPVRVTASTPQEVTNVVRVAGGGPPAAMMQTPTRISENAAKAKEETVFGVSPGGATTTLSSVQAGAHPDITTTGALNTEDAAGATVGSLKSIVTDEPPGFALDLLGTPACQPQLFLRAECPVPTQVGVTAQLVDETGGEKRYLRPVYNLAPEPGEIAKIGFSITAQIRFEGGIALRGAGEPGEYGGKVTFSNVAGGTIDYDGFSLTIWGVPAASSHDPLRWQPGPPGHEDEGFFGVADGAEAAPYFTNPTACGAGALNAEFTVTSWQHPSEDESPPATQMPFGPIVGCDRLGMEPSLTAEVTSDSPGVPTGLDVATKIPQTYESAVGLATSTLRKEVVTLPEGMTVNPSSGAGLEACSEAQYAEEGVQYAPGRGCPNESKLATVKIKTPLLEEEVTGSVFLATPAPRGEAAMNPFASLLAVYLVARIPNRGVLIKAPGKVEANETTGQLTTRFEGAPAFAGLPASEGLPPLPFSVATFAFNQGANAPLVTPPTCASDKVEAQLTPWSDPEGAPPLEPLVPPFEISTNCPVGNIPPFSPQASAGTESAAAGQYSQFEIRIARNDGEQEITGLASQLTPGLTGNLSGIPLCPEADIQRAREQTGQQAQTEPACPAGSEIGHSLAGAGVGSLLVYTPGKLYLGGPFEGAPFSVVSVTSADVGPFDLGTVVVHLPLDINPETAVVSIPAGPAEQIPHIIKGIVIHVREIRVFVNREKFMLNPADCEPLSLSTTAIGGGADPTNPADSDPVTVTSPYQAVDCSNLKFAPKFSVSTSGKTSKALGASLTVHLTYPPNALTHDANIHLVKVELPKALPSRLTTLQKACTAAVFKANPANCPAASIIGHAKVVTPILPVPLEGPAYFVSNGGEAFPNLIMVLQGYGVTIELVGDTFISKSGITSSTFKSVPDEPVGSFELTLPEGPYSALAANGNLCAETKTTVTKKKVSKRVHGKLKKVTVTTKKTTAEKLTLPTEFIASNGAEVHQQTPVEVTGCPKAKKAVKKAKGKAKHKKK